MKSGLFHCSIRQLRRVETTRTGRSPSAAAAYDYVQRRGDFSPKKLAKARRKAEKDEQLIFWGAFEIPPWGQDSGHDAAAFWKAADGFERANGRLALKIECAIPREVPRAEWKNLIGTFCKQQLAGHPCSFAVHEGRAGDGGTNPHVHFLVTERKLDGVERSPELFFRRAKPHEPAKGGAKKDRGWNDKDFFRRTRKAWADTCNKFLAEANVETRVDHRSYSERGIQKDPGVHDGPHRRAMKARGVSVRPRQKEIRDAELKSINNQIRDLQFQKANEVQIMKSKAITTDREAAAAVARGKIALQNLPLQDPVIEIERVEAWVTPPPPVFKPYLEKMLHARGWQVEWLPQLATKPNELPAFRARHPQGFEIEFRPERATATSSSDEAIKALVYTAQLAGWKAVAISGPKEARKKMEILCRAAGIKVTNPLTVESPGALSPPPVDEHLYLHDQLPPPTEPRQAPAGKKTETKKKTQKERDEIFRRADDQIFKREPVLESISDKPYEFGLRDLRYTPKSAEWRCDTGRNLYEFAREMATKNLGRYFIKADKTGKGFDRLLFCMVCDRGVDPERLRMADGLAIRHPSNRLKSAIKTFYSDLDEPIPEVVAAWLENRQPKAEAKPQPGKHAAIPLEPEPE